MYLCNIHLEDDFLVGARKTGVGDEELSLHCFEASKELLCCCDRGCSLASLSKALDEIWEREEKGLLTTTSREFQFYVCGGDLVRFSVPIFCGTLYA
jgi:hypothetical protein